MSEPISMWDLTAREPACTEALDGDAACDVAIVGGGYTGLSTALHCAEEGLACHVLEANQIGHGGSGRNVGLVNAGLWLPPQDIAKHLDNKTARGLVETMGNMPNYVFELIEKHQIRCEPVRNGTIHAAHSPGGYWGLERRAEGWRQMGVSVDLLDAEETARKTGSLRFHGGLLDRRAGTVNPMGYARGLARASLGAGATISTGTRALRLERAGEGWRVITDRGSVSARYVVLGTNAYSDDLWPGLRQTYTMIHFFQLATAPLGARAAHILPEGQGLWDTAPVMFSLRRDAAGRLFIGSMGAALGGRSGLSQRWATATLRRLYPELGRVKFENVWHGQIAMTPDHVFRIFKLADGLFAPCGYNGRGITTGTMFGKALADLFAGKNEQPFPIPVTTPTPVSFRRTKTGFYHTAFAASQLLRSF